MANNTWSNYTEKTATPVDADEVMARDSTDGKNKRLLFGTFWKWVAKKLNEATISELQTSNKTIVGALNQLNSDKVPKKAFTLNDNINDILISGNYCEIIPVWGNIGGLYPSWAWGVVLTANNIANFIGVATVDKKLAIAQYSKGTWSKIV
nr:MAG TPA: hypothetical protein [Caudoviricetes sp.]